MSSMTLRRPIAQALRGLSRPYTSTCYPRPCFGTPKTVWQYDSLARNVRSTTLSSQRWYNYTPSNRPRQYEFDDIKTLTASPEEKKIIIDVREPSEYEAGYIPGAINIPVKSQPDAIFLPEDEFEDRFGFSKPQKEKEIIFYCRSGVRSSAAAQLAQQQGYKNISEYRGSWLDWEKNGGPVEKP